MTKTLRKYARMGASIRLQQLADETQAIHEQFPELKRQATGGRTGRKLTAAARRKLSAGMRAWWAKRKQAAKKAS